MPSDTFYGPKLDPDKPAFYLYVDRMDPAERASGNPELNDPEGETWDIVDLTLVHRPIRIEVGKDMTVVYNALGVIIHTDSNEDYYSYSLVHNTSL